MYIKRMGSGFQLRVKHRLLTKPFYATFGSEEEARGYGAQLEAMLKSGIVPRELSSENRPATANDPLVSAVVRDYFMLAPINLADPAMRSATLDDVGGLRVSALTDAWVDHYVKLLKVDRNNAPGTIRKKIGFFGRILDWHIRRTTATGAQKPPNPFRNLPDSYSIYTTGDAEQIEHANKKAPDKPKIVKKDQEIDRRLSNDEANAIRSVFLGERPACATTPYTWKPRPEMLMFFDLVADTGLRMLEANRVRAQDVNVERRYLRVMGSKGHRGNVKPRLVPLKPALAAELADYIEARGMAGEDRIFPFLVGEETEQTKRAATYAVCQVFKRLAKYLGMREFSERVLRHEAACRWFELRGTDGRWVYSDVEICKLMGWSDYKQVLRYASLRGEDLAARMR